MQDMGFLRRLRGGGDRGGGDRGGGSGADANATRFSQFSATCEIRYGPDHTVVVDYATDAICPEAEAFSEILMFCHLAIHGLQWTSKENRAASAFALSRGTELDRELARRTDYPELRETGNADAKSRCKASMRFSLMEFDKHRCEIHPGVAMDQRWDFAPGTMLRFLTRRHAGDETFLAHLARVAGTCAEIAGGRDLYARGAPLTIASEECGDYVEGMTVRNMKAGGLTDEAIDEWLEMRKMMVSGGLGAEDIEAVFGSKGPLR
jgi:hypothetical protein